MTINLHLPPRNEALRPTITVFGVGGAGGNAVNNMITSDLQGVNFVVANTDAQALERSACDRRIQLGVNVTRGLGAGASPDVGRDSAEEVLEEINEYIEGSNMVFITAGMGGGTGTGAAPVIARLAREQGILTVGVVTKPFHFEGTHRMRIADYGLEELQKYVDTLIVIPNQNLFRIANEHTTFADAFKMADEVLHSGVRGVTDLMVMPGLINLDFADIRAVMREMGKAMMGTGEATGEKRAIEAAEAAISNPLLDDVSMKGAKGVLINITGGLDMTLFEVDEAANRIRDEVDADANIIFGSTFNEEMQGTMRVSVVATGIDAQERAERPPFRGAAPLQHSAGGAATQKRDTRFSFPPARDKQEASAPVRPAPVVAKAPPAPKPQQFQRARQEAVAETPVPQQHYEEPARQQQAMVQEQLAYDEPHPQPQVVAATQQHAPAFIPPRPEQPAQRSHYVTRPLLPDDRMNSRAVRRPQEDQESEGGRRPFSFFQRMAGLTRSEREPSSPVPERRVEVTEHKKAEVKDTRPAAGSDEEYLDIPAFLRRQAN